MSIITLTSRMNSPPKRGRLPKEGAEFCELVASGMRPNAAFQKVWPEKSRKLQSIGSHEVLKATNAVHRNPAVLDRLAKLMAERMSAMTEARYGRQGL